MPVLRDEKDIQTSKPTPHTSCSRRPPDLETVPRPGGFDPRRLRRVGRRDVVSRHRVPPPSLPAALRRWREPAIAGSLAAFQNRIITPLRATRYVATDAVADDDAN